MGSRTVPQHIDAFDGQRRNGVEIRTGIAARTAAVDVDQRHGMLALAIHQHQRLVGSKAAQRCRVNVVGAVGPDLAVGIERGRSELQELSDIEAPRALQEPRHGNLVDRHRRFAGGAVQPSGADDDDLAQVLQLLELVGLESRRIAAVAAPEIVPDTCARIEALHCAVSGHSLPHIATQVHGMNCNRGGSHYAKRESRAVQEHFQCIAARVRPLQGRRAHGFSEPALDDDLELRLLGKPQQRGPERLFRNVELHDAREIRSRGSVLRDEQTRRREDQCQQEAPACLLVVLLRTSNQERSYLPPSL